MGRRSAAASGVINRRQYGNKFPDFIGLRRVFASTATAEWNLKKIDLIGIFL
jgi:hypothetical protein